MEIVFLKDYALNGKTYKVGESQKVYGPLASQLVEDGIAKPKPKTKTKIKQGE